MRKSKNSLLPRTELCVVVGRCPGEHGPVQVFLVKSRSIVKRKEFIPIKPTSDDLQAIQDAMGATPSILMEELSEPLFVGEEPSRIYKSQM